jgi:ADP-heptose:LPS heptosyltransferase
VPHKMADFYNRTRSAHKVVVVDMGFLGDSLHLIPALWEIKRHYPPAELHVVAAPVGTEVLRLAGCVDRIWSVELDPRRRTLWQQWDTIRALRRERFDHAFNFSGADRTLFWTALSGARYRVAHATARKHFWNSWLIPNWVPQQPAGMPVFEQRRQFLAACGLQLAAPRWDLSLPEEARQKAQSRVTQDAIHLSVCASSPLKEWPLENWIAFVKRLLARNPQLQIIGTGSSQPREQERLRALAAEVRNGNLTTLTGLSIAELAAVLQRCQLHVGADSGVLHLAVAVGLPTISLFRDYHDASAWMPAGAAHRVFRVPCVCVNRRGPKCAIANRAECLAKLEVERVVGAIVEQLQNSAVA